MAINAVNFRPKLWSQAYNPIVWNFSSNQVNQPNFSYVVDLYVNGATGPTYRLKQRPNPAGICQVDVSPIMQPYINLSLYNAEKGWSLRYRNCDEILATVILYVGEEYDVNNVPTIFNGQGATGQPGYIIGSAENNSLPIRVLPASLPWNVAMETMSNNNDYPFWNDYIMDGDGKFLSEAPLSQSVFPYDRQTLSFLNWADDSEDNYDKAVQLVQIVEYGPTGALATTNLYNNTTEGGGPQANNAYTTQTFSRNSAMLTVRCGPEDLSLNPNTQYYTVQAFVKASATTSTSPGNPVSELRTFTINDDCTDLYPRIRLSWLNSLGGRDYANFTKFYEKSTDSPTDVYSQTPLDWSGTSPIPTTGNTNLSPLWIRGGNKSFNKTVTSTFAIQSDWLLQEEVNYLAGIAESPSVWAYIGEEETPYTVEINNFAYTYQNVKQRKLVQASFDMTWTKTQQKQNM